MGRQLERVLLGARDRGFLGPGPVRAHIEHADRLAEAVGVVPERFLDLGSGAGVPGLVLALTWLSAHATLVEAGVRRSRHLEAAVQELGLADRVEVAEGRAEDLARSEVLRGSVDLVVARSFGRPAVTAECAVGFLRPGGALVVSEPPAGVLEERWPPGAVVQLGLDRAEAREVAGSRFARLVLSGEVDDRWPRRAGVPAKRPLWTSPGST